MFVTDQEGKQTQVLREGQKYADFRRSLDLVNCVAIDEVIDTLVIELNTYTLSTYVEIELKLSDVEDVEEIEQGGTGKTPLKLPVTIATNAGQICEQVNVKSVPRFPYSGNQGIVRSFVNQRSTQTS